MPTERQPKPDPLAQAMQLYQMFQQPQQQRGIGIDAVLGLIQSQEKNELARRQLEQEQEYNVGRLDVLNRAQDIAGQKVAPPLTPEQTMMYASVLNDPNSNPTQKAMARSILGPENVARIGQEVQAESERMGLPPPGTTPPPGGAPPPPFNPLGFGNVFDAAIGAMGAKRLTEEAPFSLSKIFKQLFAPPTSAIGGGRAFEDVTQPLPR